MNLEITSFADTGNIVKERIVLTAVTDVDIGDYFVINSRASSDGVSATAGHKTAYWFPDEKVKANDMVILYTKAGVKRTKQLESGRTAYFYYWGLTEAQWNREGRGAVLLEAADWEYKIPSPEFPE